MTMYEGKLCGCCALWAANRDDSSCDCDGHDRGVGPDPIVGEFREDDRWFTCMSCENHTMGDYWEATR